jgi:hypothetical protein
MIRIMRLLLIMKKMPKKMMMALTMFEMIMMPKPVEDHVAID